MRFRRVLYLSRDPEQVRGQLSGNRVSRPQAEPLADNVSTDEMAPAWASYYYDDRLTEYCLVGFRGGVVGPGAVRAGNFEVLVGGESFGCGSSRETAPYAQRGAGILLVIARSFEKIYRQNCQNLGLHTSTDWSLLDRIDAGEEIEPEEVLDELDELSRNVVYAGGLGEYGRARLAGQSSAVSQRSARSQTMAEKIVAAHRVHSPAEEEVGGAPVAPGDSLFIRADLRFSHDYVTAMSDAQMRAAFGEQARVSAPETVALFRDHLTFLDRVMPDQHRRLGLFDRARELAEVQQAFAEKHGLRLFAEDAGICHNLVIEALAWPGQVVVGTDSHTCMAGVLGCLAFGVGSTEMATGFVTRDFRICVPETVRVELRGQLPKLATAKDLWLTLLGRTEVKRGVFRDRVLEFGGEGFFRLPFDERATLTNMAAEAGAFTAIAEPDLELAKVLVAQRGLSPERLSAGAVWPDPGAEYAARLEIDLARIEPMLALPGDPKNGVSLRDFLATRPCPPRVDIAYGGSCTGGKRADMDLYASVIGVAVQRGQRIQPGTELFIQFGSRGIRVYAEERGYVDLFRTFGATLLEPACGACIRAGPGVSTRAEQVTVSAVNRNFPGRSGPGQVYLASPLVVAASAVQGYLASPEPFLGFAECEKDAS